MDDQSSNEELLSSFLLGQLSEAEQAAIEERFLGDREYYQHLLIAEDELRCAYAKGSLPPAEREQFEKRFMVFPDERHRVELARAMIFELSGMPVEAPVKPLVVPREEKGWLGRLLAAVSFRSPVARFATATVAVVLMAALSWLAFETYRLRRQVSQLEARQAAQARDMERSAEEERLRLESLNRELLRERNDRALLEQELVPRPDTPPASSAIMSLLLTPGRLRGEGDTNRLTISQSSTRVVLMLKLGENNKRRSYRAVVVNSEGARVWSRDGLRGGRQLLVLRIPARFLAEDDYEINVTGLNQSGDFERVGDYYFTILKK